MTLMLSPLGESCLILRYFCDHKCMLQRAYQLPLLMSFNLQCLREALTPRATLSVAAPSLLLVFGSQRALHQVPSGSHGRVRAEGARVVHRFAGC